MKRFINSILFFVVMMAFLAFPAFAGEVTITLEWDPNSEDFLAGYKAYVADAEGGPYIKFGDIPKGTETINYIYNAPDGAITQKFFVVTAYSTHEPPMESGNSNEVNYIYDFAPIEMATEFTAILEGDDITFTWRQGDIERVKQWKLYVSEIVGGPYVDLAVIEYIGSGGPQYSTTESMIVPAGEIKTFYFVLITFTPTGVFSGNSAEISVTIDKRELAPVYNLRIRVITQ